MDFTFALLGIVALAAVVAVIVARLRFRRQRIDAAEERLALEPLRWASNPTLLAGDPDAFAIASTACYAVPEQQPVDRFGFAASPQGIRATLRSAWRVDDARGLRLQILALLTEGHRKQYDAERDYWLGLEPKEAKRQLRKLQEAPPGTELAEQRVRVERYLADTDGIREADLAIWDLSRAVMLCRIGVGLGMLDEEIARDTSRFATAAMRARHRSWQSFWDEYHAAKWLWCSLAGASDAEQRAFDLGIAEKLLAADGPCTFVSISAPIEPTRLLLLDQMAELGELARPLTFGPRPWERELAQYIGRRVA